MLGKTDILVSLLPHTPETEGILNLDLFKKLAKDGPLGGGVIINAGRGKLQVEDDIATAINQGILAGASLDVFEQEPLPSDSPLMGAAQRHHHAAHRCRQRAICHDEMHRRADQAQRSGRADGRYR